jgi:hypothetical protein
MVGDTNRSRHPTLSMPNGLRGGEDLVIYDCPWWDGVIPLDAEIGGRFMCNGCPGGIYPKMRMATR